MREYETTLIVQPEISEEGSAAIFERLDGILEKAGAIRLFCEDLGKRKLAYEIRKFHKGHYYTLEYLDSGQVVPDLERVLRMDESVLRFLTVQAEEEVTDVEARKERARDQEVEQSKRAADRAAREAEEAKARAEAEAEAAATAAAAPKAADESDSPKPAPGVDGDPPEDRAETVAKAASGEAGDAGEPAEGAKEQTS